MNASADPKLAQISVGETDTGWREAAAWLEQDPTSVLGLLLVGRWLVSANREAAQKALNVALGRALEVSSLPLALVACDGLRELGHDVAASLTVIAETFAKGSPRLRLDLPPPLPVSLSFSVDPATAPPLLLSEQAAQTMAVAAVQRAHQRWQEHLTEGNQASVIAPQIFFSAFDRPGLRRLLEAVKVRAVAAQATVVEQGTLGDEIYVVASGNLDVVRRDDDESPAVLAHLQAGALFGEMAILSRAPRAASVVARAPSLLLCWSRQDLDQLSEADPTLGEELVRSFWWHTEQNLVRTSPVLQGVPPEQRKALLQRFVLQTFERGETLIRQGDEAKGISLIASGGVAVSRLDEGGNDRLLLATLGVGDIVGEVALVLRRQATADVIAEHPTICLFLPREGFYELIRTHPLILTELYHSAVARDEETASVVRQATHDASDYVLL